MRLAYITAPADERQRGGKPATSWSRGIAGSKITAVVDSHVPFTKSDNVQKIQRVFRSGHLTPEEVARDEDVRRKVQAEFPPAKPGLFMTRQFGDSALD